MVRPIEQLKRPRSELAIDLDVAARVLRENRNGTQKQLREGPRIALHALITYLGRQGYTAHRLRPLTMIADAMEDLNVGTVPSLLRPVDIETGPYQTTQVWIAKIYLVFAIEVRKALGANVREAAATVAQAARPVLSKVVKRASSDPTNALMNLRKEVFSRAKATGPRDGVHAVLARGLRNELDDAQRLTGMARAQRLEDLFTTFIRNARDMA